MARTRVKEEPPLELPPATLFLDDLDEIIRLFREALNEAQNPENMHELALKIRVDDWECDTLDDLRALGEKTTGQFYLDMEDEYRYQCALYIYRRRSFGWSSTGAPGLGDEATWALYGRLNQLLEKRTPIWSPWRGATVIFQNSYEYKGFLPALKRHSTAIIVAVVSSILTIIATRLADRLIHVFHHAK